jgi:site-specific recombinase XerD
VPIEGFHTQSQNSGAPQSQTGKRAKLRFHVHPHMLRHSTGYYLANRNHDTRLIQDYLGHKNIAHTVRYTRTAASRFEGLWR